MQKNLSHLVVVAVVLAAGSVHAATPLRVHAEWEKDEVLLFEPIRARVVIQNQSGATVEIPSYFEIHISDERGEFVPSIISNSCWSPFPEGLDRTISPDGELSFTLRFGERLGDDLLATEPFRYDGVKRLRIAVPPSGSSKCSIAGSEGWSFSEFDDLHVTVTGRESVALQVLREQLSFVMVNRHTSPEKVEELIRRLPDGKYRAIVGLVSPGDLEQRLDYADRMGVADWMLEDVVLTELAERGRRCRSNGGCLDESLMGRLERRVVSAEGREIFARITSVGRRGLQPLQDQ